MTQKIPSSVVEGRGSPFPAGTYFGSLGDVKDRWIEDRETKQRVRLVFDVSLKDITPIDGANVGNRPFRQSITIIQGEQSLVDIVEFDDNVPYPLRQAAGLVAQLASALGAAKVDLNGDVTMDTEAFLEDLKNGAYAGTQVIFEVVQRAWKPKDAPKDAPMRVSSDVTRFQSAEATEAETPDAATTASARSRA